MLYMASTLSIQRHSTAQDSDHLQLNTTYNGKTTIILTKLQHKYTCLPERPYTALNSWWWVELSPETCRVKPLRRINAIVASCWIYFTILVVGQSAIWSWYLWHLHVQWGQCVSVQYLEWLMNGSLTLYPINPCIYQPSFNFHVSFQEHDYNIWWGKKFIDLVILISQNVTILNIYNMYNYLRKIIFNVLKLNICGSVNHA